MFWTLQARILSENAREQLTAKVRFYDEELYLDLAHRCLQPPDIMKTASESER